jgi:hypothetical protein
MPDPADRPAARSVLGARERANCKMLAASLVATDPEVMRQAPGIADSFRQQLPDLDDVTIGRILLAAAGSLVPAGFLGGGGPLVLTIMAAAGLHLTDTEWNDTETSQTARKDTGS